MNDIRDTKLAPVGATRIEWAGKHMPVLEQITRRFAAEKPLHGLRIGACLHVTTETANLMRALKAAGAQLSLCASNPLSTQDDVAASLVTDEDISVFAKKGEDGETYYAHLRAVLDTQPHITMDDGADLVSMLHSQGHEKDVDVLGGTEETTTGVIRLRNMEKQGVLAYPIIAVKDAQTKHLFDNRYGTGQSVVDGILRATNLLLAGTNFVVCGFGWCGKGIAVRAKGMGANVIVIEIDPLRALEAVMEGYRVLPMEEAATLGDIFVTSTGNRDVIRREHFEVMKDGAILANAGHFDVEIELDALRIMAVSRRNARNYVQQYILKDGRCLNLLADGRLVNLGAAEGHPASVMDLSFANQALSVEFIAKHHRELEKRVYAVPEAIDKEIARLKLKAMGIRIDTLTEAQREYLASWREGT
ncbi:MAG: adenosylhomocysteinase [Candidatus Poribacteria bacterium]